MVLLSVFASSASGVAAVNEQLSSKVSVDKTDSADEDRMVSGIHSAQAVGDEIERESKWKYIFSSVSSDCEQCLWYGLNSRGMIDLEFSECEREWKKRKERKHVVVVLVHFPIPSHSTQPPAFLFETDFQLSSPPGAGVSN